MKKTWQEIHDNVKVGDIIRVVIVIDTETEDGTYYTKPYETAVVDKITDDEIAISMDEGECDGFDFYFRKDETEAGELMLESDYILFTATEEKVWEDVNELLPKMKAIKDPSPFLISLINEIEKFNKLSV